MQRTKLLARMGVMVALGVAFSYVTAIPAFGARLFPAQHAINVVAGAMLGPWYGAAIALTISVIRMMLGTGTPVAIPGSVVGAIISGLAYRYTRSRVAAITGEVVGTGVLGALAAYPVGVLIMNNAKAAAAGLTFYIPLFVPSSLTGAILGGFALVVLEKLDGQTFQAYHRTKLGIRQR